jgi:hypothetical protein
MKLKRLFLAAIVCVLSDFAIAQSPAQAADKPVSAQVLIKSISDTLAKNYVFPERAQAINAYLKKQLQQGAYRNIANPRLLAEKIANDIQSVQKDGHLRVHYRPAGMPQGPGGPPDMVELQRERAENFHIKKLEVLNENIGYLQLNGFTGFAEEAKPVLTAALRFLANTDAIIIDLTNNGGGAGSMVELLSSYFYPERTRLNDMYNRVAGTTEQAWAEPAHGENMKLSMPVYILTSHRTFSAAEDFSYAMQVNKRALTVGEASGGGAHPLEPMEVGQGFVVDVPYGRSINHITKTDWEGTGVIPDIPAPADQALQKAREAIFKARLATAKTAQEQARLQWSLTALKAHDYDETVSKEFPTFVGGYERFNVEAKDNRLYLTVISNGRTYTLKPISGGLFLVNDSLQAEFVKNADGKMTLKFLGEPGSESMSRRMSGERDVYERT